MEICATRVAARFEMSARSSSRSAFTLIEMLVVIAVIGILAAMIVGLAGLAGRKKVDARMKGELEQLITVIDAYKAKKGFYPPSNPNDVTKPPLYYELLGTRRTTAGDYEALNRANSIPAVQVSSAYGVEGFVNSKPDDSNNPNPDPDAPPAESFHENLKDSQTQEMPQDSGAFYLGIPYRGPDGDFSRWRYNSVNPTNNPGSYDLWVEVDVSGTPKTYGNWKQ